MMIVIHVNDNNHNNDDYDDDTNTNNKSDHFWELFYDRNPGDARVKVGSERKVASSPSRAELRCRRDRYGDDMEYIRGTPPNLALLYGNLFP